MGNTWDWSFVGKATLDLLSAVPLTLLVTVLGAVISLILGALLAILRVSRSRVMSKTADFVSDLLRGTPFLAMLFFVFYAFPQFGVVLDQFATGVLVLGLYYAGYASDAFRSAVIAIPRTTLESCVALNLSIAHSWRRVIVPLAVRASVPTLMNYGVMSFKQTAILVAIGLPILLGKAQQIGYGSFRYLEVYTIAGIIYLLISYPLAYLARRMESKRVFD